MYIPNIFYKTIREAQVELLYQISHEGIEVEDTFEVNNISICITNPFLNSEELKNVTPIAAKHMDQMLLKPNPDLPKTHYERLHNYVVGDKQKHEMRENLVSYNQIKECIERLKENPFSKRCVLTLWSPEDVSDKYTLSWTFSQLLIRDNKLIMTNYFRSCDIYNAFPWNMIGIANLQKYIANRLNVECGEFIVHIGSAHIYKVHKDKIVDIK
jgi:thymidylate synthase